MHNRDDARSATFYLKHRVFSIEGFRKKVHNAGIVSEERTRDLSDSRSFEDRVFARFDAMEVRLDKMEARSEARFDAIE